MANGYSEYLFDTKVLKKGQVTIFIFLAIVLVIGIILVFLLIGNAPEVDRPNSIENPKAFIRSCVGDAVDTSLAKVMANGGRITPTQYIMYQDEEYNYLCYQGDYYLGCYNTHPMLETIIENEIRKDTKDDVQDCFDEMKDEYEAQGFSLSGSETKYSIDLVPGAVEINLNKKISISKGDSSQTFEDFDGARTSSIYNLVKIVRDIVNSESEFCNVEYNGYMVMYPEYEIKRFDYSDSKLYWVRDRASGEEFKFAVRSCAFAPGI